MSYHIIWICYGAPMMATSVPIAQIFTRIHVGLPLTRTDRRCWACCL